MYVVRVSAFSFKGEYRENNEDNYYINGKYMPLEHIDGEENVEFNGKKRVVLAVFDGLGGEDNGEVASYTAATVLDEYKNNSNMREYFMCANERVCALKDENSKKIVGTTACVVCIEKGFCVVSNIGDSKIYFIREGKIKQLSEDHTTLSAILKSGVISKEDVKKYKMKDSLSQCLGIKKEDMIINPFISESIEIKDGDMFVICSDGVSNSVDMNDICNIMKSERENLSEKIVRTAVENGAKDNATVVTAKIYMGMINVMMRKFGGE